MITHVTGKRIEYDIKTYRYHSKEKTSVSVKTIAAAGAVIGTLVPMAAIAKKQKTSMFKINYGLEEMLLTSAGSIAGALAGGLPADKKEYRKQKINEGVFQFMNASVPTILTAAMYSIGTKIKPLNNIPCKILATVTGLFGGMHLAAKLSNKINDPYDKVPDRKLSLKDSVANIDDALGVLVLAKVPAAEKLHLEKVLPAIYSWCGYRAGISN